MDTLTNGLSQGDFTLLNVLHNGSMQNIITLIGSLGGGTVDSATAPLSISGGVLSIDLSSYSTTAQITSAITTALAPYVLTTTLGGYSTTTAMNTAITNALASYVTSTALTNALAAYTDTTTLNTLLAAKQNTLTAGTGISITGATISSTHTPIILQLDGATQTGATMLNFVGNTASFANNVLNISRMAWQDAVTLRYSNSASDKNITQGSAGELLWDSQEVQLRQNAFHQISVAAPLTVSGSTALRSILCGSRRLSQW